MELKVPARVRGGAFGVDVFAVLFDKREGGGWRGRMADRPGNAMRSEY